LRIELAPAFNSLTTLSYFFGKSLSDVVVPYTSLELTSSHSDFNTPTGARLSLSLVLD